MQSPQVLHILHTTSKYSVLGPLDGYVNRTSIASSTVTKRRNSYSVRLGGLRLKIWASGPQIRRPGIVSSRQRIRNTDLQLEPLCLSPYEVNYPGFSR